MDEARDRWAFGKFLQNHGDQFWFDRRSNRQHQSRSINRIFCAQLIRRDTTKAQKRLFLSPFDKSHLIDCGVRAGGGPNW